MRTHSACPTCQKYDNCKECYYQALKESCRIIHKVRLETGGDTLTTEQWIEKLIWKVSEK